MTIEYRFFAFDFLSAFGLVFDLALEEKINVYLAHEYVRYIWIYKPK